MLVTDAIELRVIVNVSELVEARCLICDDFMDLDVDDCDELYVDATATGFVVCVECRTQPREVLVQPLQEWVAPVWHYHPLTH